MVHPPRPGPGLKPFSAEPGPLRGTAPGPEIQALDAVVPAGASAFRSPGGSLLAPCLVVSPFALRLPADTSAHWLSPTMYLKQNCFPPPPAEAVELNTTFKSYRIKGGREETFGGDGQLMAAHGFDRGDSFVRVHLLSNSEAVHITRLAFHVSIIPQSSGLNERKADA